MESLAEYIAEFRVEMAKLGYADGEINVFVSDATENKRISQISKLECAEIIEHLEDYLVFAKKCRKLVMNS
jgi:2-polyprenyl-3-methyl-5-hydroxy-6-metoxy-1,4-benzoquinol methylase